MSATAAEIGVYEAINKFRQDPTYVIPYIKNLKTGIARLDPKNEMLKKYDNFVRSLGIFEPQAPLRFSEELSEAARKYLEKCKQKLPDKKILKGEKECKGIVPENYLENEDSLTMVAFHDTYDRPEFTVIRLLIDNEDEELIGRKFLTSELITQVGIAVEEMEDDEAYCVIIFDDDEYILDDPDFKLDPEFDDSELRKAFEALDFDHKNKLNIAKVCEMIKSIGKDKTDPELALMFEELKKSKNEEITYPEFAQHFHSGMIDNESNKGRRRIFEIFKPTAEYESIDMAQLKRINEYVGAGFTDKQIATMLKMNNHSKYGITFDDYVDRLEFKKEHPEADEQP